jgi:hypothetical protein
MRHLPIAIALAAAVGVVTIGFRWGTYAAGGSDSSCYALMADAFASGHLQPTSAVAAQAPWPDAARTFTPGGFQPSETRPNASSPICAPGFSVLLAPFAAIGGRDALFAFTPLAGAFLVGCTFIAGRALGGPTAGAAAAALMAASPALLYQVVQPMNDIATTAAWMATFAALVTRRWVLAGVSCGLALLVRPNLLPLALVTTIWIAITAGRSAFIRFGVAAFPFGALVLWLNAVLYGSPLKTGYGQASQLFGVDAFTVMAPRYLAWLFDTHSVIPFLAVAAPFVARPNRRADVWLALALCTVTCAMYFVYTPFDDWSYLRFLLPAIGLMLVLAGMTMTLVVERAARRAPPVVSRYAPGVVIAAICAAVVVFCLREADRRLVFNLRALEQRYRSAGLVVRDALPADAVVLSVWDSGAVRFHGRKEALSWEGLDPMWLDRALNWLTQHGHQPFILVESWEEPGFRTRFGAYSDAGKLDWPPKYEIDRLVRIYDPRDRAAHISGRHVATEYLWPLRR